MMKKTLSVLVMAVAMLVGAPTIANAAVTQTYPGCTTTGVCMTRTDGTPIGYDGTGTTAVNQANIRSVAAGTRTTTVKLASGTVYTVAATKMITFVNGQTITSISR